MINSSPRVSSSTPGGGGGSSNAGTAGGGGTHSPHAPGWTGGHSRHPAASHRIVVALPDGSGGDRLAVLSQSDILRWVLSGEGGGGGAGEWVGEGKGKRGGLWLVLQVLTECLCLITPPIKDPDVSSVVWLVWPGINVGHGDTAQPRWFCVNKYNCPPPSPHMYVCFHDYHGSRTPQAASCMPSCDSKCLPKTSRKTLLCWSLSTYSGAKRLIFN